MNTYTLEEGRQRELEAEGRREEKVVNLYSFSLLLSWVWFKIVLKTDVPTICTFQYSHIFYSTRRQDFISFYYSYSG
ncbi:MAG: hypothetical protein F6K17_36050 [Okeania sp. SIO3C4]|nr:hypothetical protein [Okeania sp. SIO3C4]